MVTKFNLALLLLCISSIRAQIIDVDVVPVKIPCPFNPGALCIFRKATNEQVYQMVPDNIANFVAPTVVPKTIRVQREPFPNPYGMPTTERVISANPGSEWPPKPPSTWPPSPVPINPINPSQSNRFTRDWKLTTIYGVGLSRQAPTLPSLVIYEGVVSLEYCNKVRGVYTVMGNQIKLTFDPQPPTTFCRYPRHPTDPPERDVIEALQSSATFHMPTPSSL